MQKIACLLLFSLVTSSCGYRWHIDWKEEGIPSLEIAAIATDSGGDLMQAIVRAWSESGLVKICERDAAYRLEVSLVGRETERIGYRRDPQSIRGEVRENLVGSEGRSSFVVEVSLYDQTSQQIIQGPYKVQADLDYDYVDGDSFEQLAFTLPSQEMQTVLSFSLGQLESEESAQEAAGRRLNQKIAEKIVDVISSEW